MPGRIPTAAFAVFLSMAACGADEAAPTSDPGTTEPPPGGSVTPPSTDPPPATDPPPPAAPVVDPVVFVHGVKGGSENFKVMIDRLVADGWPVDRLSAIDYADPEWGCNTANAEALKTHVEGVLAKTGAKRVDIVAHSMGTLSSRRFVKILGGLDKVATYVTLGGMHHGVPSSCFNPLPVCVWQELCGNNPYLQELNAAPATPGPVKWVSIYSKSDETVSETSAHLDGAENIEFDGVDHSGANGLLERAEVYAEVKRVLAYVIP